MNKKNTRRTPTATSPSSFDQARDEMFSHILRCWVIEALPERAASAAWRAILPAGAASRGARLRLMPAGTPNAPGEFPPGRFVVSG